MVIQCAFKLKAEWASLLLHHMHILLFIMLNYTLLYIIHSDCEIKILCSNSRYKEKSEINSIYCFTYFFHILPTLCIRKNFALGTFIKNEIVCKIKKECTVNSIQHV